MTVSLRRSPEKLNASPDFDKQMMDLRRLAPGEDGADESPRVDDFWRVELLGPATACLGMLTATVALVTMAVCALAC